MKQNITIEQWNELTSEQQEQFKKVVQTHGNPYVGNVACCGECGSNCLPSIGQMIQFINDRTGEDIYAYGGNHTCWKRHIGSPQDYQFTLYWDRNIELCDALWRAVKNIFNKE